MKIILVNTNTVSDCFTGVAKVIGKEVNANNVPFNVGLRAELNGFCLQIIRVCVDTIADYRVLLNGSR